VGEPNSGKSDAFRDTGARTYIDIPGSKCARIPPSGGVVILDHFERVVCDPENRRRGIEILESLVLQNHRRVILISAVDPLYYLEQVCENRPDEHIDVERWTRVLARFHLVTWPQASAITGDGRWRLLWQTCSAEEQRALYHLASSGLANYRHRRALMHLMERGLIVRGKRIWIVDPKFECYILRAVGEHELGVEKKAGAGDTLAAIRMALIAAAAVLVITLVCVLGEQTLTYVTTGITAVAALGRLIAGSKSRPLPEEVQA
jgi:hypothetical protein